MICEFTSADWNNIWSALILCASSLLEQVYHLLHTLFFLWLLWFVIAASYSVAILFSANELDELATVLAVCSDPGVS